jgi:Icc-related predicted phosphoesterase
MRNTCVTIHGVKFYGIPLFKEDVMEGGLESKYEEIPSEIDVLITNQPPLGILDDDGSNEYSSAELLSRVLDVAPRVHLFGHIHNATGIHAGKYTAFFNGSVVNQNYEVCKCGNRLVF